MRQEMRQRGGKNMRRVLLPVADARYVTNRMFWISEIPDISSPSPKMEGVLLVCGASATT